MSSLLPHRRGGAGSGDDEEQDWKYDFDAPDVADLVKDHKPNFVKAPKRCFEKTEGYYSDEDGGENEEPQNTSEAEDNEFGAEGQSDPMDMDEGSKGREHEEEGNQDEDDEGKKEDGKFVDMGDQLEKNNGGDAQADSFKKVTRAEWSKMTLKEKKKYLKERRMWKNRNTVFIKDDSDNEQLTDDEKDIQDEDLQFSDVSEDEKEKV